MTNRALEGIRVLDFTSMVSGPYCTRLLADCGAEVVKVEPTSGDTLRAGPPFVEERSRYFAAFNCGKKSVVLDLRAEEDSAIARLLAEKCDVVVENFRPGVMEKLGLGYPDLSKSNPGMVYASISGFGQTGPMANFPAYAPVIHALSGFDRAHLGYQTNPEVPPNVGIQMADVVSAAFAFGAIQTALFRRERTGEGDWIDISLIESMMATITGDLQSAQVPGTTLMSYRPIRALDDYIIVTVITPKTFMALHQAISDPTSNPPETLTESLELLERLEEWASKRPAITCQRDLMENGVPCATYETPESVLGNEHLLARGSFATISSPGGAFKVNNAPFQFQNADSGIQTGAPELGEHTDEVQTSWLASRTRGARRNTGPKQPTQD